MSCALKCGSAQRLTAHSFAIFRIGMTWGSIGSLNDCRIEGCQHLLSAKRNNHATTAQHLLSERVRAARSPVAMLTKLTELMLDLF